MFGRIYLKLYVWFILIFLVTMLIVLLLSARHFSRDHRQELEAFFLSHARFLAEQYQRDCGTADSISSESCRRFFSKIEELEGLRLWVINETGNIIATKENREIKIDQDEMNRLANDDGIVSFRRPPRLIVRIPNLPDPQRRYLVLERSGPPPHRPFQRFPLAFSMIIVGVVTGLLVLPLSLRITRPLIELHRLAQEWSEGKLDRRAKIRGKDEIAQLGGVFNIMAENLQKTLQQRKEFLALISHELKSPLARIRIALELLADKNENQTDSMEIIHGIESEISESEQLIEQLLILSRIEMTTTAAIHEPFDILSVAKRAAEQVQPLAKAAHITIEFRTNAVSEVRGEASQIQRAIANVLENAIKFSPPDSNIILEVQQSDKQIEISIADSGPGIPEEEHQKIFEPFYRGTQVQQKEGSGLGLFIARRIIELHHGNIRAFANHPAGTIIKLSIPN